MTPDRKKELRVLAASNHTSMQFGGGQMPLGAGLDEALNEIDKLQAENASLRVSIDKLLQNH